MRESVQEKKDYIRMLLNQKQIYQHKIDEISKVIDSIESQLNGFDSVLVDKVKKEMEVNDAKESKRFKSN